MSNDPGTLFLVCGSAGSGKTTLVNSIVSDRDDFEKGKKYSTRPSRGDDDDVISLSNQEFDKETFDLAYQASSNRYGLKKHELLEPMESGSNVLFPLTDIRATKRIKQLFEGRCVSVCVMSALNTENFLALHGQRYDYSPKDETQNTLRIGFDKLYSAARLKQWNDVFQRTQELIKEWEDSLPQKKDIDARLKRVSDFQAQYFENLAQFDHVVLNYRDGHQDEMLAQFVAIADSRQEKKSAPQTAPLFVVSGASGSGKGMLAASLRQMAPHEVSIVSKQGKRAAKKSDKRDGMQAIGKNGTFTKEYDFRFTSHKAGDFDGTEYAFDSTKVQQNINQGVPQYLVSNVLTNADLRQRLINRYGESVVFLYLWRLQDEHEMIKYQRENCHTTEEANGRILETQNIYDAYVAAPDKMHHVLLNTGYPEGLASQFFHLLDYYQQSAG